MNDREHAKEILQTARRDLRALRAMRDLLRESGVSTDTMDSFVDLNAFAVQYRYESLYTDEEAVDRPELADRIESLIDRVAAALQG